MKQDLRRALQNAFEPPAPKRKDVFFRSISQPEISNLSFMVSQAGYIRKYVWGISAVIFGTAFAGTWILEKDVLWVISALLPFAAVSAVAENNRSNTFLMCELEMAARFSLKSVVLARMGILGLVHLLLLIFLIPVCAQYDAMSVFRTGVYLLVPYLLTTTLSLWAARRIQGMESMYVCMGTAVCVSGIHIVIRALFPVFFGENYVMIWVLVLAAVMGAAVKEWKKMIKQTEELAWN